MKQKLFYLIMLSVLVVVLASCRNETQNQIRRSIQDFTGSKMYITLYSLEGNAIYEGVVDGKITRSESSVSGTAANGSYVYWYDDKGQYHQTDLPYLLTSFDRSAE